MGIAEDYEVLRREYEALRDALPTMHQRKPGGFVRFLGDVCQMVLVAVAIVGGYFLLSIFVGEPAALPPPQTNAQPPAVQRPAPHAQPGTTYGANSLPSCADVMDTRTACQGEPVAAPAAAGPLPTEPPAPTATDTPAYVSACWNEPGERPCWLPADQPWQAPADVPSAPIVLVDEGWHAPMALPADACADWHPPAPYPEGCGDE